MRKIGTAALMVPVSAAAGYIAIEFAKRWNEVVGFGGAIMVGIICSLAYLTFVESPWRDDDQA